MNSLISVIIPIYNVEEYLVRCVNSILNQTYDNMEIILVDDGSPDNSGKIADELAERDNRIIVYHKKNGGLSDARNFGVSKANGEYITFIDSDDYVADDYVEYLYSLIRENNADISVCAFSPTSIESFTFECDNSLENIIVTGLKACELLLGSMYIELVTAWGKMYRKELVHKYPFPFGRKHEDEATTAKYYYDSKTVAIGKQVKYAYFQNPNGIMSIIKKKDEKNIDAIWARKYRADFFEKENNIFLAKLAWKKYYNYLFDETLKLDNCCRSEILEKRIGRHLKFQTKILLLLYTGSYPIFAFVWEKYHKNL